MHRNSRDLAQAGLYVCCLAGLLLVAAGGALSAIRHMPDSDLIAWAADAIEPSQDADAQATRIGRMVANAREIRAALAKPIAGPEPLTPITAKLAFGHLKPGGKGALAARRKPKPIDPAAMDAMAMAPDASSMGAGQPFGGSLFASHPPRASNAVQPELHKVY